jgi:hypothetical protein
MELMMGDFFSDSAPAWTNKEVLKAFGSAAAVLIPTLVSAWIAFYRIFSSNLRHRLANAHH